MKTHLSPQDAMTKLIELGWTQTELSDELGTSQSNISRIANGLQGTSSDLADKIRELLK
jgi:transcriptional regulator with XRE-family HTH domain